VAGQLTACRTRAPRAVTAIAIAVFATGLTLLLFVMIAVIFLFG
jgi:hypothetical protein